MRHSTIRFDFVKAPAQRRVTCPGCGKRRTVKRTFTQTVNPFNKNEDGTVKTPAEVWKATVAQAKAWVPDEPDRYHQKCWDESWEAKP